MADARPGTSESPAEITCSGSVQIPSLDRLLAAITRPPAPPTDGE